MVCFLCGKEIGWLRSTVDRQYCSDEHRKEARMASANVVKEEEEEQELWSVSKHRAKQRTTSNKGQISMLAFLGLSALLVMMVASPGGGTRASGPAYSLAPAEHRGWISRTGGWIGSIIEQQAPVSLHHEFSEGMGDWTTVALRGPRVDDPHDWKKPSNPSLVMPGTLRLWSRSTLMRNYQMEFQGQIEKRSLSWAFRATSAKDYYAAKIVITKPGPLPNAGLIHYLMLNGREMDRVQLPLPITLDRGKDYYVRVSVQDDHFITYLNGQVISSWRDQRLTRGGVGFFADSDDAQKVSWVNLSERDSFLGQMMAHFSLFIMPGATPGF